ncbi:MAG: FkbM family methyltransferase [Flammeovirgaceae bacterium]
MGFEPNANLFNFLVKKYNASKNIQLFQQGISNEKTKLIFNENIMDETSTFESVNVTSKYLKKNQEYLGLNNVSQMIVNRYEVEVTSLADFFQENKINEVDVSKIDTEEHKYNCLLGLFQNKLQCKIDYIQLESHNDDMYNRKTEKEIEELLNQNNYLLDVRIRHGFGSLDELIYKRIEV